MPRAGKSRSGAKEKRKAAHIEESYEKRGVPKKEAKRRAYATVNKQSGATRKSDPASGSAGRGASSRRGSPGASSGRGASSRGASKSAPAGKSASRGKGRAAPSRAPSKKTSGSQRKPAAKKKAPSKRRRA